MSRLSQLVDKRIIPFGILVHSKTIDIEAVAATGDLLRLVGRIDQVIRVTLHDARYELEEGIPNLEMIKEYILFWIFESHIKSQIYLFKHILIWNLTEMLARFHKPLLEDPILFTRQAWQ